MTKKLENYINLLMPDIEKIFKSDKSGHDLNHLRRTMKNALYLQAKEGGDEIVVGLSALLHDIHRIMQTESCRFVNPKQSLPLIEKLLGKIHLDSETVEKVLFCIEHHESYNWSDEENKNRCLEAKILQDADNLDAVGAIGIVRCFNYGLANDIPWHNASKEFVDTNDYKEEYGNVDTSVNYFYKKLFKLADNMNTKTAKIIANQRVEFMKLFVGQLLSELDFCEIDS